jgi:hypothetical protein
MRFFFNSSFGTQKHHTFELNEAPAKRAEEESHLRAHTHTHAIVGVKKYLERGMCSFCFIHSFLLSFICSSLIHSFFQPDYTQLQGLARPQNLSKPNTLHYRGYRSTYRSWGTAWPAPQCCYVEGTTGYSGYKIEFICRNQLEKNHFSLNRAKGDLRWYSCGAHQPREQSNWYD